MASPEVSWSESASRAKASAACQADRRCSGSVPLTRVVRTPAAKTRAPVLEARCDPLVGRPAGEHQVHLCALMRGPPGRPRRRAGTGSPWRGARASPRTARRSRRRRPPAGAGTPSRSSPVAGRKRSGSTPWGMCSRGMRSPGRPPNRSRRCPAYASVTARSVAIDRPRRADDAVVRLERRGHQVPQRLHAVERGLGRRHPGDREGVGAPGLARPGVPGVAHGGEMDHRRGGVREEGRVEVRLRDHLDPPLPPPRRGVRLERLAERLAPDGRARIATRRPASPASR